MWLKQWLVLTALLLLLSSLMFGISVNDAVQSTTTPLNVRSSPSTSGTLLFQESQGFVGRVKGGPVFADTYWWWQVQWANNGQTGWSVQDYLLPLTTPPLVYG